MIKFIYRFSGVKWVVDSIQSAVLHYRLRLRMVPVSFKVFIWSLGVVTGASGVYVSLSYENVLERNTITIENVSIPVAQAETEKVEKKDLSDYIWMKESSRGKNNYSKCEEIGKVNGIGYGIPGDGSYICFDSHEDEMAVLKGWIISKQAAGWSEKKILCTYSGNNYDLCGTK